MTVLDVSCTTCSRPLHDGELVQLDLAGGMTCTECVDPAPAPVGRRARVKREARDDGR